ncbi:MAG: hemin uptake protein HemP [Planctomycetaceae bacterium]
MTDERTHERERRQGDNSDLRVIDSKDLLKGRFEVLIDHEGTVYKLRMTKARKLILNKP